MPFVHVRALSPGPGFDFAKSGQQACEAIGAAINVDPRLVFLTWDEIAPAHYLNGGAAAAQPRDSHPPIVHLSTAAGRPQEQIDRLLSAAGESLAAVFGVAPANVVVVLEELHHGKQYTKGVVKRT